MKKNITKMFKCINCDKFNSDGKIKNNIFTCDECRTQWKLYGEDPFNCTKCSIEIYEKRKKIDRDLFGESRNMNVSDSCMSFIFNSIKNVHYIPLEIIDNANNLNDLVNNIIYLPNDKYNMKSNHWKENLRDILFVLVMDGHAKTIDKLTNYYSCSSEYTILFKHYKNINDPIFLYDLLEKCQFKIMKTNINIQDFLLLALFKNMDDIILIRFIEYIFSKFKSYNSAYYCGDDYECNYEHSTEEIRNYVTHKYNYTKTKITELMKKSEYCKMQTYEHYLLENLYSIDKTQYKAYIYSCFVLADYYWNLDKKKAVGYYTEISEEITYAQYLIAIRFKAENNDNEFKKYYEKFKLINDLEYIGHINDDLNALSFDSAQKKIYGFLNGKKLNYISESEHQKIMVVINNLW